MRLAVRTGMGPASHRQEPDREHAMLGSLRCYLGGQGVLRGLGASPSRFLQGFNRRDELVFIKAKSSFSIF